MNEQTYRVWFDQVDQTYVDVAARSMEEARDKAYRRWRKEWAHSSVSDIVPLPSPRADGDGE